MEGATAAAAGIPLFLKMASLVWAESSLFIWALGPNLQRCKRLDLKNPEIVGGGERGLGVGAMALAPKTRELAKRSGKFLEEALYRRLFREGNSPASVRNQLEEFLKSRKRVHKWEVGATIRRLRDHKLFRPALKVPI